MIRRSRRLPLLSIALATLFFGCGDDAVHGGGTPVPADSSGSDPRGRGTAEAREGGAKTPAPSLLARAVALFQDEEPTPSPTPPRATDLQLTAALSHLLEEEPPPLFIDDIAQWALLQGYYRGQAYAPAWVGADGLEPRAIDLLNSLCMARREGLRTTLYQPAKLREAMDRARLDRPTDATPLALLELQLAHTFLSYAHDRLTGFLDPRESSPHWRIARPQPELIEVLRKVAKEERIVPSIEEAASFNPQYELLLGALEQYRAIAAQGGWEAIPAGVVLKTGSKGPRVAMLRKRLALSGDLALAQAGIEPVPPPAPAGQPPVEPAPAPLVTAEAEGTPLKAASSPRPPVDLELFDKKVASALDRFQRRHGLAPSRRLDPPTLKALNVPVEERILQLEINLERWRWLPGIDEERYVLVNIPEYMLYAWDDGKEALSMPVVVGRDFDDRSTPVFSDAINAIEFSPYWYVPLSILEKELLPELRKDPAYLDEHAYEVITGYGKNATVVDPTTINWKKVDANRFPYRIRQRPGPLNSLGLIKFVFPNPYNVYLHDTPQKSLFTWAARAQSHGCIRVSRPVDLAEYILDKPTWDPEKITELMEAGTPKVQYLSNEVPIYIVYLTAFVREGEVNFRQDIYSVDRQLKEAFRALEGPEAEGAALCDVAKGLAQR